MYHLICHFSLFSLVHTDISDSIIICGFSSLNTELHDPESLTTLQLVPTYSPFSLLMFAYPREGGGTLDLNNLTQGLAHLLLQDPLPSYAFTAFTVSSSTADKS